MQRIVFATSLIVAVLDFVQASPAHAACTVAGLVPGDTCINAGFANGNFQNRDLHGVTLTGANLRTTNFSDATLTGAKLDQAQMRGSNLTRTNFVSADLQNAVLGDTTLIGADLSEAKAIAVDLGGVHGAGAVFFRTTLDQSSLYGADFTAANFSFASMVSVSTYSGPAKFVGAKFRYASLRSANLRNADLTDADFTGADLTNVIFTNATLSGAIWSDGARCAAGSVGRCNIGLAGPADMAITAIQPRAGMWRAAADGTGYLFETPAAGGLRLVVIGFDGLGAPTWSIAEGPVGRDNVFTADLKRCASAGTGPADCGTDLGPVVVSFDSPTAATLLAPSAVAVRIAPATQN